MINKEEFNRVVSSLGYQEKVFSVEMEKGAERKLEKLVKELWSIYPYVTVRASLPKGPSMGLPHLVRIGRKGGPERVREYVRKVGEVARVAGIDKVVFLIHGTFSPLVGGLLTEEGIIGVFGDPVGLLRFGEWSFACKWDEKTGYMNGNLFWEFYDSKVSKREMEVKDVRRMLGVVCEKKARLKAARDAILERLDMSEKNPLAFLIFDNGKINVFNYWTHPVDLPQSNRVFLCYKDLLEDYDGVIVEILRKNPKEVHLVGGRVGELAHISVILRERGIKLVQD